MSSRASGARRKVAAPRAGWPLRSKCEVVGGDQVGGGGQPAGGAPGPGRRRQQRGEVVAAGLHAGPRSRPRRPARRGPKGVEPTPARVRSSGATPSKPARPSCSGEAGGIAAPGEAALGHHRLGRRRRSAAGRSPPRPAARRGGGGNPPAARRAGRARAARGSRAAPPAARAARCRRRPGPARAAPAGRPAARRGRAGAAGRGR